MRGIDDSRSLTVQLGYPLEDLLPALWIDRHCRLIKEDQLWLVGDPAGDVQSSFNTL